MVRDLDINQTPKMEKDREWIMISATPHVNDDEDGNSGGRRRKKLRLTKDQSHILEESFIQNHTLTHVSINHKILWFRICFVYVEKGEREMEKEKEREGERVIFS